MAQELLGQTWLPERLASHQAKQSEGIAVATLAARLGLGLHLFACCMQLDQDLHHEAGNTSSPSARRIWAALPQPDPSANASSPSRRALARGSAPSDASASPRAALPFLPSQENRGVFPFTPKKRSNKSLRNKSHGTFAKT